MSGEKFIELKGVKWRLTGGYYKRHITIFLHRQIWEDHFGVIPEGNVIHHKDGNKLNNDITNLECLSKSDHHKKHWQEDYEKMHKITSENFVKYERTKKHKKETGKRSKEYWRLKKAVKLTCKVCGIQFSTRQPELAKRCRLCQKKEHYRDKQDERICKMCNNKFECYLYSKTFTCSQSCAVKHAWITKRGTS